MMEEQKEAVDIQLSVSEVIEDSMTRMEFTIQDGYLVNVAIEVKSREDLGRIDLNDKVMLLKWLGSIKAGLFQSISNQPTEVAELGVEPEPEKINEVACQNCGGELTKKKDCCGRTGEVYRCKTCGRSFRFVKGKVRGTVPPPSPVTSPSRQVER
jgi:predicted RNA-binding Zn-ribbon protein involved in translation (DUF1610 family)